MMKKIFIFFFSLFLTLNSFADDKQASSKEFSVNDKEKGWFWYKYLIEPKPEKQTDKPKNITIPNIPFNPIQVMKEYKYMFKYYKDLAILVPTEENIRNYLVVQKAMLQRSEIFAKKYMEVVMKNPDLDYSTEHATSENAGFYETAKKYNDIKNLISRFKDDMGILYFYIKPANCEYCEQQSKIIKFYSEKYGIYVYPVSVDGYISPQFKENTKVDPNAINKFQIKQFPATYLVFPKKNTVGYLGQTLLTENEINKRILYALKRKEYITDDDLPRAEKVFVDENADLIKLIATFRQNYKGNLEEDIKNFGAEELPYKGGSNE